MDPLSALSVAAAVVQFVDYSSRMVSKSREIYKSADGALAENIDLEVASKCLQRLTEPLRGSQIVDALGEVCKACECVVFIEISFGGIFDSEAILTSVRFRGLE